MSTDKVIQSFHKIAWGTVLIYLGFNINLGSISIQLIPTWLGYLWYYHAIAVLEEKQKSLALLKPLCTALIAWYAFLWCSDFLGISFQLDFFGLLASIISLYFHFQFLTDLAEIGKSYQCDATDRLLQLRTVRTILLTIPALPIPWEHYLWSVFIIAMIHLIVIGMTCSVLFKLRSQIAQNIKS